VRVAAMTRFAEQHRPGRAVGPRRPRLIRVPYHAVLSAPRPPQLEALGGAK